MTEETISAFAYRTAQEIERKIDIRVGEIQDLNEELQALILSYYHTITDPLEKTRYGNHFWITDK